MCQTLISSDPEAPRAELVGIVSRYIATPEPGADGHTPLHAPSGKSQQSSFLRSRLRSFESLCPNPLLQAKLEVDSMRSRRLSSHWRHLPRLR